MTIRKILEDAPLGRVFTNVQKTSVATAANLIAGDKPRNAYSSYSQPLLGTVRVLIYVNLKYNKTNTVLANVTPNLTTESGLITQLSFSSSTPMLLLLGFCDKAGKNQRQVYNTQPVGTGTINGNAATYTTFYNTPAYFYSPATYSNLTIPFTKDELLWVAIMKTYNTIARQSFNLTTTYYSDPIKV